MDYFQISESADPAISVSAGFDKNMQAILQERFKDIEDMYMYRIQIPNSVCLPDVLFRPVLCCQNHAGSAFAALNHIWRPEDVFYIIRTLAGYFTFRFLIHLRVFQIREYYLTGICFAFRGGIKNRLSSVWSCRRVC